MNPHRGDYVADGAHIVSLQVIPDDSPEAIQLASQASPSEERLQTISLNGIVNVPTVLLAGQWIQFMIPASEEL
jgi:hypothetical protein